MSGSASLGLEQAVLGHTLGFAPMVAPTQVFVALCLAAPAAAPAEGTPGTEVSGLGYYRTPATFALATSPANMAANVAAIEFPMALAAWGTVGYFELWDAQVGGNRLYWGQLIDHTSGVPATLTVASGDIVRFSPGTLAVQAAAGVGGTSTSPWLPVAGGTMTGPITLAGNATLPLQAVPLQQLNTATAGGPFLPLSGITPMTGPLNYTATGGTVVRSAQDRAADVVNVKDFGAVFDGNSHPLSSYYPTLASAQAVYPHAVALTDEIDGVAIQAAINLCQLRVTNYSYGGTVQLPCGNGLVNQPLTISKQNVSLVSQGAEFMLNSNIARATPSAPTRLTWTGTPRTAGQFQINMLTVAPTDNGRLLSGTNVRGILFYCNQIAGTSGPLIASVRHAIIECATYEPAGIAYPGASLTAGSQAITVSSTAGMRVGESVVSASLPGGVYVASIIDATHFNASAQANATSTETVTIGGTGIRFDVVDNLNDSNDTQYLRVRFAGYALAGAANATGPLCMIGGSSVTGSGGGTHFGNTSLCWFDDLQLIFNNGHGCVANNSDHNLHENLVGQHIGGGAGRLLICNGSLDPNNGPARYHVFNHLGDGGLHAGTDTGGFLYPAVGCRMWFLDRQNAGPMPTVGVGANVYVGADNQFVLTFTGSTQPIVAQCPDLTEAGGNYRGTNAVDLQMTRTTAAQIASGRWSVLSGGNGNSALGDYVSVTGGQSNNATGTYSTVLGGAANFASQSLSVASGSNAVADLIGVVVHGAGLIAGGRHAQHNKQLLRATSAANTTPVRLTADGLAAGATNVCNLTFANQANTLSVQLVATDTSNAANVYSWQQPVGLIKRLGGVASSVYVPGTPVILTSGTTTGIAITEAADTINGGYSLTFTPPTGNTAIWRVVATVEWTRVDGA